MFAIAFDLKYRDTAANHPKSVTQAYADIKDVLALFAFERIQGSVYVSNSDDLVNLFNAVTAMKALTWFPLSVGNIRVFRVEHGSDFTAMVKTA